MIRPARNALRAAVESGFPSARYAVQVVLFAPVEYLTYGIRSVSNIKRLVGADIPLRPILAQSISITSPVWRLRICIAFCKLKIFIRTNQTPGKIQGRGRSPLLGRFKGDCQGGESKLPLDYAFFRPSTALSFSYEKESGVENTLTEAFRSTKKTAGGVPAVSCFLTAPDRRPASRRYTSAASARRGYSPRRSA